MLFLLKPVNLRGQLLQEFLIWKKRIFKALHSILAEEGEEQWFHWRRRRAGRSRARRMAMAGLYRRILPSPPSIDFASSEGKVCFYLFIFCFFSFWIPRVLMSFRDMWNRLFDNFWVRWLWHEVWQYCESLFDWNWIGLSLVFLVFWFGLIGFVYLFKI